MYPTRTRHAAPISMTPHKGPFEPFFSNPDDETMLREHELIVVQRGRARAHRMESEAQARPALLRSRANFQAPFQTRTSHSAC